MGVDGAYFQPVTRFIQGNTKGITEGTLFTLNNNRITTMKAVQIPAPSEMCVVEVAKPQIKSDEVLLQIKYVGFCGSDLNTFLGKNPMVKFPILPGHELDVPRQDLERLPARERGSWPGAGDRLLFERGRMEGGQADDRDHDREQRRNRAGDPEP